MLCRPAFLLMIPAALALQGCVAALIPIAAGAGMVSSGRQSSSPPATSTSVSTPPAAEAADRPPAERTTGEEQALLPSPQTKLAETEQGGSGQFRILEGVTELPAPSRGLAEANITRADTEIFASFADYALSVASRDILSDELRESALLVSAGSLEANRTPCRFTGNAVMIDLDPADGVLDPALTAPRPDLSTQLLRLRTKDVAIFWSSALTADRAGDVRTWLRETGLDPDAEDEILLLRYPDDRKQTRREEAAKARCLIAMLGDERADFDELFDYLKNPDAAIGLNPMFGKGWFLAQAWPAPRTGLEPAPVASAPLIRTEGQR